MSDNGSEATEGEDDFFEVFLRMGDGEFREEPDNMLLKQQIAHKNRHLDFCIELLNARIRKRLTQTELAKMINSNKSVIQAAESRRGNPRLLTLLLIAEALDMRLTLTQ